MRTKMAGGLIVFAAVIVIAIAIAIVMLNVHRQPEAEQPLQVSHENPQQLILSFGEEQDAVTLSWKGDQTGPGVFRWADSEEGLLSAAWMHARRTSIQKGAYWRYSIQLEDLQAGQTYWYQLGDGIDFDAPKTFCAPEADQTVKLLLFADPQFETSTEEYRDWGAMAANAVQQIPELDFAVLAGDMVNDPTDLKQWNAFLDQCGVFQQLPMVTVPGNHEGVRSNHTYHRLFPDAGSSLFQGFGFLDYGCCRLLLLDSSFLEEARSEEMGVRAWETAEQTIEAWLTDTLKNSKKAWNIVIVHHPPYGMHDRKTVSPQIRERWTPIMEQYGVDLVFSGHQHMYLRTAKINGILYVMGNSGGMQSNYYSGYNAPLYAECVFGKGANYQCIEATDHELKLTAYSKKGFIIDETSISKESFLSDLFR